MKKTVFLILLLVLGTVTLSLAQEKHKLFTVDSLFIPDLSEHLHSVGENDEKAARESLSSFSYCWTANLLFADQKMQVQQVCKAMLDQKLSVSPYFIAYLKVVTLLVRRSFDQDAFNVINKSVFYCLGEKNSNRSLLAYLSQVNLLIEEQGLLKSTTEAWYCRNAEYKFSFDSVPSFDFTKVTLTCTCRGDSSCIYDTHGRFFPLQQKWVGSKGTVYWDREGLSRDDVYAKLADYSVNTRVTYYSADSVILFHGGFIKKPLQGKLEEKVMADVTQEKAIYPRFSMYPGNSIIINLNKEIEYEGGFSLEGAKIVGFSSPGRLARIMISRNKAPFIELRSKEFVIRPDRFVSARANAVIYIENDSIYHPGVQVRYNRENNEIAMTRADEGLSKSPFFNTYHKIDMLPEALYWKLDDSKISFEAIRGIRSKGEALFSSSDYFSAYNYDKLQGIDEVNPVLLVSMYVKRHSSERFYGEDLASFEKKPIEQVKVQLIRLANEGFLIYDIDNDFVTVKPRLNEYLASHNEAKDYDIIQLNSFVEKGSNAILDLNTLDLTILGVKADIEALQLLRSNLMQFAHKIEKELKKLFGKRLLVVAGDLPSSKIVQINKNFDASYPEQDNNFDILLSSDKISEGFNLNRAGMVINYDIPWNPVRVIQRVGRINRISKKVFNELFIVNFFPTEQGAELVKSREIAQNKMFLIHTALGEDAKYFDVEEEPTPAGLYNRIQQNPEKQEEESFYTKALNEYEKIKKANPELIEALKSYPPRIKVAKAFTENELLVFYKKGRLYVIAMQYSEEKKPEPYPTALDEVWSKIICAPEEKALPLSDNFWPAYETVKSFRDYRLPPVSEQSLEQKALNVLDYFIRQNQAQELLPQKDFLRTLREDILDYGTLSDYTLRRIGNLETNENKIEGAVKEIKLLKQELGEDYLFKEKARQKDMVKEIIIAIENVT